MLAGAQVATTAGVTEQLGFVGWSPGGRRQDMVHRYTLCFILNAYCFFSCFLVFMASERRLFGCVLLAAAFSSFSGRGLDSRKPVPFLTSAAKLGLWVGG